MPENPNKITTRVVVEDIKKALEDGVPITCATCSHFHAARLMQQPTCGKECGGPLSGKDFPEYSGQIPRNRFGSICLMCGDSDIAYHVVVAGLIQKFGLCEKHKSTFDGTITHPDLGIIQNPIIVPLKLY